jgi:hypothetical protein
MTTLTEQTAYTDAADGLQFVWLEITGKCQLECLHCYAESGPGGTHGAMTAANWRRVIPSHPECTGQSVKSGRASLYAGFSRRVCRYVSRCPTSWLGTARSLELRCSAGSGARWWRWRRMGSDSAHVYPMCTERLFNRTACRLAAVRV